VTCYGCFEGSANGCVCEIVKSWLMVFEKSLIMGNYTAMVCQIVCPHPVIYDRAEMRVMIPRWGRMSWLQNSSGIFLIN